jgi:predicted amidohydrolase
LTESIRPYAALPLQVECKAINGIKDISSVRYQMKLAMDHCGEQLAGSKAFASVFSGDDIRLVVLPEYFMTGFPMGESTELWQKKACVEKGGHEYDVLGKLAQDHGVYLSGNAYELDAHFPELYFQTSFIIADNGDPVLRYRRLVSMFAATPHDVLDAYLDHYGADSLFPVADTPLGRLACVASEEILYPEITRALALRGAEVICHSSSEVSSPLQTPKNIAKQARAFENMVYVVSANSGGISGTPIPPNSTDGHSQVVNYRGKVLAEAGHGESINGFAEIDIESLRRTRSRPAMSNMLARQRLELFADTYSGEAVYPANNLLENGTVKSPSRQHFIKVQEGVIESLKQRGIL